MKEFKLREINMDNLYHITISNNKAIENAINELRQEVEELKLQLSRIKKDKHENIDNRDAIIEKLKEILVHVSLPGEYNKNYDVVNALKATECKICEKIAAELSILEAPPEDKSEAGCPFDEPVYNPDKT